MEKILSIVLSSLVIALAMPLAYGQQLGDPTSSNSVTDQDTTSSTNITTTTPEAIIGKSENLTVTDLRYRAESNQITGTVTNNSTNEQSSISIYAYFLTRKELFLE